MTNTPKRTYYPQNLRYINKRLQQDASTEVRLMQKTLTKATENELSNMLFACALHKIRPSAKLLPQWHQQWQKLKYTPSQNNLSKVIAAYCELGLLESLEQRNFCLKVLNTYLMNVNYENGIGNNNNIITVFKCINMMLNAYDAHVTEIANAKDARDGLRDMVQVCHRKIGILSKTNERNTALFHQYIVFHNFCATILQQVDIAVLPPPKEIQEVVLQENKDHTSSLEKEVYAELLNSLSHLRNIKILQSIYVPEIAAKVDIIFITQEKKLAVQVDGKYHYFWDDKQKRLLMDGSTILNTKLLEISGIDVYRVNFMEWNESREFVINNIKDRLCVDTPHTQNDTWVLVVNKRSNMQLINH